MESHERLGSIVTVFATRIFAPSADKPQGRFGAWRCWRIYYLPAVVVASVAIFQKSTLLGIGPSPG